MREATSGVDIGVKVGGYMVNSVRFANDKAVEASSEKALQEIMDNKNMQGHKRLCNKNKC